MSEVIPEFGGCYWPVDPACFSDDWASQDQAVKDRALALASSTLERLTGGRVGNCPITVRPLPSRGCCWVYGGTNGLFEPHIGTDGQWRNACVSDGCSITLPPPVGRIDQVKVDGAVVPSTDYRVIEGDRLVWMGTGDCPWPHSQDVTLPDTEPGTMSVTYLNAYPVDSMGAYAAGLLAQEFLRACSGSKGCRLPRNVTNVVRQGISFEIATGLFPEGKTGINEVDAYVALWNPANQRPSTVWSPGSLKVSW